MRTSFFFVFFKLQRLISEMEQPDVKKSASENVSFILVSRRTWRNSGIRPCNSYPLFKMLCCRDYVQVILYAVVFLTK